MPVTGEYLDTFNAPFLARITSKLFVGGSGSSGSGSGVGQWQYAWIEQDVNPSTGAAINCASPRQGTTTLNYAVEINNNEITVPIYRWLRLRSLVLGQPVYEFSCEGSGYSGTVLKYRTDCVGDNRERWVQMVTYSGGVVVSNSPWLFDSMQGCCSCVGYMPGGAGAQGDSTATGRRPSQGTGCCPAGISNTLCVTISGTACSCMNGSFVMTYGGTDPFGYGFGAGWFSSPIVPLCGFGYCFLDLACVNFPPLKWELSMEASPNPPPFSPGSFFITTFLASCTVPFDGSPQTIATFGSSPCAGANITLSIVEC